MTEHQERPDLNYIRDTKEGLLGIWREAQKKWADGDRYYNQEFPIEVEKGYQHSVYRPSDARNIVDNPVNYLVTSLPVIKREPLSDSELAQRRADNLEKWAAAMLWQTNRRELFPPFKQAGKNLFLYGFSIIKGPLWDVSLWPEKPERNKYERDTAYQERVRQWRHAHKSVYPFITESPHPSLILASPSGGKAPDEVVEVSWRLRKDLKAAYPKYQSAGRPYDQVECLTYWSKEWHGVVADNQEMMVKKNPYDFVPYVCAFSGFGQPRMDRPKQSLADQAVGILDYIKDSLRARARQITAMDVLMQKAAYNRRFTTEDAEELADKMSGPGDIVQVDGGKDAVWWEDVPQLPQWGLSLINIVGGDQERGTYADALRGLAQPGVTSGRHEALLGAAARQIFNTPLMQLNSMAELYLANCARMVEVIGEPVTVQGNFGGAPKSYTVSPEDFEGCYDFTVSFESSDPAENQAKLLSGVQLLNSQAISLKTFWEKFAGIGNFTEEMQQMLLEAIIKSAPVQQQIGMKALQEWGMEAEAPEGQPNGSQVVSY